MSKTKKESAFQADLIKKIKNIVPDCIVLKNDSGYIQGIPDLVVLGPKKWAALEVKKSANAHRQPNQEYYVDKMNELSYANFVYPENEEEVLNDIRETFKS